MYTIQIRVGILVMSFMWFMSFRNYDKLKAVNVTAINNHDIECTIRIFYDSYTTSHCSISFELSQFFTLSKN